MKRADASCRAQRYPILLILHIWVDIASFNIFTEGLVSIPFMTPLIDPFLQPCRFGAYLQEMTRGNPPTLLADLLWDVLEWIQPHILFFSSGTLYLLYFEALRAIFLSSLSQLWVTDLPIWILQSQCLWCLDEMNYTAHLRLQHSNSNTSTEGSSRNLTVVVIDRDKSVPVRSFPMSETIVTGAHFSHQPTSIRPCMEPIHCLQSVHRAITHASFRMHICMSVCLYVCTYKCMHACLSVCMS